MFKRFFIGLLDEMLPKKTKRQVFLISFAALLKGATTYDRETFQKLNRVLDLAEGGDAKALAPGAILSRVIWNGKTPIEVCGEDVKAGSFTADRLARVVGSILSFMPKFLMYGDTQEIEKDVSVILQDRIGLLGA